MTKLVARGRCALAFVVAAVIGAVTAMAGCGGPPQVIGFTPSQSDVAQLEAYESGSAPGGLPPGCKAIIKPGAFGFAKTLSTGQERANAYFVPNGGCHAFSAGNRPLPTWQLYPFNDDQADKVAVSAVELYDRTPAHPWVSEEETSVFPCPPARTFPQGIPAAVLHAWGFHRYAKGCQQANLVAPPH